METKQSVSENPVRRSPRNVVILETDHSRRDFLRSTISQLGYVPFCFEKETICFDNLPLLNPDLIISGPLPLERTYNFINTLKIVSDGIPVLMISNEYWEITEFIDTNGCFDVLLLKTNVAPMEIRAAICNTIESGSRPQKPSNVPLIVGNSPEMVRIKKMLPGLGRSRETVFLHGEMGTGKELIAKAIHSQSDQHDRPFIKFGKAGVSVENSAGGSAGDFSWASGGAVHHDGAEIDAGCGAGTLYIDEIGRLSAASQAMLLQLYEPAADAWSILTHENDIAVRIIAASSRDCESLIETGNFRKDLFYRLNVIHVEVPPLRKRPADIPLLANFFKDKYCKELGRGHYEVSRKTNSIFCRYHWPGNISELKDIVGKIVMQGDEDAILENICLNKYHLQALDLVDSCRDIYSLAEMADLNKYLNDLDDVSLKDICKEFMARAERKLMGRALNSTNGNRKKAAQILNISYKSLLNKMKVYKLA